MIRFIVYGDPVGKGRPRAFRRGKHIGMYTPKKTSDYEQQVKAAAIMVMPAGFELMDQPVALVIRAYFAIPKSMTKALRARAEEETLGVTKKPDIDNICKAVADALNGVVYKDDAQVIEIDAKKRYSKTPRVEVIVVGWVN